MFKIIKHNIFQKIDATGLGIFRVFYMIVLMNEIKQLYMFKHIIYDKVPFNLVGEINVDFIFYFWFFIIGLIFFGLFTRIATIINYIFSVIIFSSATAFEYHVFKTYVSINFLIMFIPISKVFSLDVLIEKIKLSKTNLFFTPNRDVLAINYYILILLGLAFVYFDSVLYKFESPMWLNGLGLWLPASLPMVVWTDSSWLLNSEYLVKILSYFTLIFETVFIFLFWYKFFRIPLLVLGIFLHFGIFVIFPIPYFSFTAISLYILLVPVSFWKNLAFFFKCKNNFFKLYYSEECQLCIKLIIFIKHFDIFNKIHCIKFQEKELFNFKGIDKSDRVYKGYKVIVKILKEMIFTWPIGILLSFPGISKLGNIYYKYIVSTTLARKSNLEMHSKIKIEKTSNEYNDYLTTDSKNKKLPKLIWNIALFMFFLFQLIISWFSPLSQNILTIIKLRYTIVNATAIETYKIFQPAITNFLGITNHGVFMDHHFNNYNHIFKIEYCYATGKCKTIPIINNEGMPDKMLRGSTWCNFTFNIISSNIKQTTLEDGVGQYLKYYKSKYLPINENNIQFDIYVKEIESPKSWQRNFLRKQISKPWKKMGKCLLNYSSVDYIWIPEMINIFKVESN